MTIAGPIIYSLSISHSNKKSFHTSFKTLSIFSLSYVTFSVQMRETALRGLTGLGEGWEGA